MEQILSMENLEDFSDYHNLTDFDNCNSGSQLGKKVRIFDGVMQITAGILGLIGNTLVFIAFAVSKRLQTKTNMFVINLAFADILTSLLTPIFGWSLIADIEEPAPRGIDTMCALAIGIAQASIGCSLFTLAAIALNRMVLITRRKQTYEKIYRSRNVAIFVFIAWSYPVVCETLPLLFGVGELGFDRVAHICGTKTDHRQSYLYDVLVVGLILPIPMAIIAYSYARILYFVKIHNKQQTNNQQSGFVAHARIR